jgi:hypothetical protein
VGENQVNHYKERSNGRQSSCYRTEDTRVRNLPDAQKGGSQPQEPDGAAVALAHYLVPRLEGVPGERVGWPGGWGISWVRAGSERDGRQGSTDGNIGRAVLGFIVAGGELEGVDVDRHLVLALFQYMRAVMCAQDFIDGDATVL